MVKNTRRDQIWAVILEMHRDLPTQITETKYDNVAGFTKADVQKRIDGDVSKRTINDVVQTMAERGLIEMVKEPAYASLKEHPITGERVQANVYRIVDDVLSTAQRQDEPSEKVDETVSETVETTESSADDLPFQRNAGDEIIFQELPGVGADRSEKLISNGFESLNDLFLATVGDVTGVDGFGEKSARDLKIYIANMVRKRQNVSRSQIHSEPPKYIAREFNLDQEAAEQWAAHTDTKIGLEEMEKVTEDDLYYAKNYLLPYLDDDDGNITHYVGT